VKDAEQLDGMVEHICYEIRKLMHFLYVGNGWVYQVQGLPPDWASLANESMLEAALIHARCVAEFLRHSGSPDHTITAKDYVPSWHWTKGERLKDDLAEVHGRVAHLGLIRLSAPHQGDAFNWLSFLQNDAVPTLLNGFRIFLGALTDERREQFNRPTRVVVRLDLIAEITLLIGAR